VHALAAQAFDNAGDGSAIVSTNVTITNGPATSLAITTQPKDQMVLVGSNVTFTGEPPAPRR
jgi:hypothetical protein